jgi:HAD superfamily phosphoserine phosphatase-like hydrolase
MEEGFMKLDLYDFDKTIYNGDSSVDFFKFCLKKDKRMIKLIFKIIGKYIAYKAKYLTLTEFKEYAFSYLNYFENGEELVKEFWNSHECKIKEFYKNKKHDNDIIISASPEFLLKGICKKLGVKDLIASDVDIKTGHFNKENNRGEVKVNNLKKKYPKAEIMSMYSDSEHDKPLFDMAKKAYLVKGNKIYDYRKYKPNVFVRFWRWGWGIYHKKEDIWNYLIVGGLTTVISIASYALFAKGMHINYIISNILSWVIAVIFAYYTNRWFVFHSKDKQILKEAIKFVGSRVLTLLIDTGLMVFFVDLIKIDDLIAKIIVQVVVIVANYVLSKLIVFKNK